MRTNGADQPAHSRSLICAIVVRTLPSIISSEGFVGVLFKDSATLGRTRWLPRHFCSKTLLVFAYVMSVLWDYTVKSRCKLTPKRVGSSAYTSFPTKKVLGQYFISDNFLKISTCSILLVITFEQNSVFSAVEMLHRDQYQIWQYKVTHFETPDIFSQGSCTFPYKKAYKGMR